MENRPCLVSVLCAAYNHEDYIRQALESFLAQETDFDFEILVNDDASTDGTAAVIRELSAQHPGLIRPVFQARNQYSQGVDICADLLYPLARGKYVALCEGDDYWCDPQKLHLQAEFLESHPDYTACVHNTSLHFCQEADGDRPLLPSRGDGDVSFDSVVKGVSNCFHTSSIMARRDIVSRPPDYFYVGKKYGFTDYPEALWLISNGPIRYLDRVMSVYRINSGAASWSSGVSGQYGKLRCFITGKRQVLLAFRPTAPAEYLPAIDRTVLDYDFELMYIEGRDREQRRPPYDKLLRAMPLSYRAKNAFKCLFPGVQRLYRQRRGYRE